MSDATETVVAVDETTEQPTPQGEGLVAKATRYYQSLVMGLAVVGFVMFEGVSNASAQINIDADAITAGFFDGFNMILGLTGLLALMALPYGIQFAFGFLSSIFSKFSSVRF